MAKHNPKLNPCRPLLEIAPDFWDKAGEIKESKWINGSAEKTLAAELVVEGAKPRHMRKVFFLSGRQLRKAVTEYKRIYKGHL